MTQAKIKEIEELLSRIYYDPSNSASFRGVSPLLTEVNKILLASKRTKLPRQVVVDWLQKQDSYTTIKDSRVRFPTNPYKIPKLTSQAGIDLIDLSKFENENLGFRWILVFMSMYSRFVWTEPDRKSIR